MTLLALWIADDFAVVVETPVLGFGGTGYLHGLFSQYHFIFSASLTGSTGFVWYWWGSRVPKTCLEGIVLGLWESGLCCHWICRGHPGEERPLTGHPATYACFCPVETEVSSGHGFLRQIPGELPSFLAFQWDKRNSSHREGVPSPGLTPLSRCFFFHPGEGHLPETLCLIALGDGKETPGLSWSSFLSELKPCNHPTGCFPACQSLSSQPLSLAALYKEEEISGM